MSDEELKRQYRRQLINHSAASLLAYLICLAGHNLFTWFVCYLNDMNPRYYFLQIATFADKESWNVSNVTEIYLFAPVVSLFTGAIFFGLYRIMLQSTTLLKLLFLWLGFWFLTRSIGAAFAGAITFKELGYYLLWNFAGSPVARGGMIFCALLVAYFLFKQVLPSFYQSAPVFDLVLSESGDQSRRKKFVFYTITMPCLITLGLVLAAFVPDLTRIRFWLSFTFRHEMFIMLFALFGWLVIYRSITNYSSTDVMLFKNHIPMGIARYMVLSAVISWIVVRMFHENPLF